MSIDGQLGFGDDESEEARRLRDEGIKRAYEAALAQWKLEAVAAIHELALERSEFTTDPVWQLLAHWQVDTPEHRAMAGVLKRAEKLGYIQGTGQYVKSTLAVGHARRVQIYLSKLWRNPDQLTIS